MAYSIPTSPGSNTFIRQEVMVANADGVRMRDVRYAVQRNGHRFAALSGRKVGLMVLDHGGRLVLPTA